MSASTVRMAQGLRDLKVAKDVGAMNDLRVFEEEYETYGTVFWEGDQRHYLVSQSFETICAQVAELELKERYPLPVLTNIQRKLVPSGWEEEIAQQVKVDACNEMRLDYPERLWETALQVADGHRNDAAAVLLAPIKDELEGTFDSERIMLFEKMVGRLYLRRNLTSDSYALLKQWIWEERQEMANDVAEQDSLCTDFYGFAYRDAVPAGNPSGDVIGVEASDNRSCAPAQYWADACLKTLVERRVKVQQTGAQTSPIFHRKCWHGRNVRPMEVRRGFLENLKQLYDADFFALLDAVDALPVAIDERAFLEECDRLRREDLSACLRVWEYFGRQWGVKMP